MTKCPVVRVTLPNFGRVSRSAGTVPQPELATVRFQTGVSVPSNAVTPALTLQADAQLGVAAIEE